MWGKHDRRKSYGCACGPDHKGYMRNSISVRNGGFFSFSWFVVLGFFVCLGFLFWFGFFGGLCDYLLSRTHVVWVLSPKVSNLKLILSIVRDFLVALYVSICMRACKLGHGFISTESSVLANPHFLICFNKILQQALKIILLALSLGFSFFYLAAGYL